MADIFISYASDDRSRIELLAKTIENQGWSVWWDRKITPGKTFSQVIEEAIKAAKCVVVLWSNKSVKSDWVQNEAAEGAKRKILVPALIDDVQVPFEFRRIQAADLTDWKAESIHLGFTILLSAISEIVGPSPLEVKETEQKREEEERKRRDIKPDRPEPAKVKPPEPKQKTFQDDQSNVSQNGYLDPILIPAGNLIIGSPESEPWRNEDEERYEFRIKNEFYLGKYPVTIKQYKEYDKDYASPLMPHFQNKEEDISNLPVTNVTWEQAVDYAKWLTDHMPVKKYDFRLPTEAEWEYAARKGMKSNTSSYLWGDGIDPKNAKYMYNKIPFKWGPLSVYESDQQHNLGICDMFGNELEWTASVYTKSYSTKACIETANSLTEDARPRAARGGCWRNKSQDLRIARRFSLDPGLSLDCVGFRLAGDKLPGTRTEKCASNQKEFRYDVALSYTSEDREYVKQVADFLKNNQNQIKVFYDRYEEVNIWGKNILLHLSEVIQEKSQYCVIFISEAYAAKPWTYHELTSAQARAFEEKREYLLPARFDSTKIPGLLSTIGYIDLKNKSPEEFGRLIIKKIKKIK